MDSLLHALLGDLVTICWLSHLGRLQTFSAPPGVSTCGFLFSFTCSFWGVALISMVSAIFSKPIIPKSLSSDHTWRSYLPDHLWTSLANAFWTCPLARLHATQTIPPSTGSPSPSRSAVPVAWSPGGALRSTNHSRQSICLILFCHFPAHFEFLV